MINKDIDPDEIFVDSKNLPDFDKSQFEGRLEKPIYYKNHIFFKICISLIFLIFGTKLFSLQISNGEEYKERSEKNRLHNSIIFAPRGIVYDRLGKKIAWNETTSDLNWSKRIYLEDESIGNLMGFIKYPAMDSNGYYYEKDFVPKDGVELYFNDILSGKNGMKISEVSVDGQVISQGIAELPTKGRDLKLTIDIELQTQFYKTIQKLSEMVHFQGGAGVIMDVNSGEIISMVSFPSFNSNIMTEGKNKELISQYSNSNNVFINRNISGLYTPGSIVKPFLAFGALEEKIISPEKEIVSTGELVVPNPYDPKNPTIFKDWRAHGAVDMRRAIAVSSDVYFYQIGGGFGKQRGLGIEKIKKYLQMFGFSKKTGFIFDNEEEGVIPDQKWKSDTFDGEIWRLGDTYNTSIGQYGTQITPIQAVVATASLANDGFLVKPSLVFTATNTPQTGIKIKGDQKNFNIAKEGMRQAVLNGTAVGLNTKAVNIAGKTGTAELGAKKQFVNSWSIGFFPYEKPKYAFALVMERGPVKNLVGATAVMRELIDWVIINRPEYIKYE